MSAITFSNVKMVVNGDNQKQQGFLHLGRELTTADIGKKIVRVCPWTYRPPHAVSYDWSFVPEKLTKESACQSAQTLRSIKPLTFEDIDENMDDDGNWLPLDEFEAFIGTLPSKIESVTWKNIDLGKWSKGII